MPAPQPTPLLSSKDSSGQRLTSVTDGRTDWLWVCPGCRPAALTGAAGPAVLEPGPPSRAAPGRSPLTVIVPVGPPQLLPLTPSLLPLPPTAGAAASLPPLLRPVGGLARWICNEEGGSGAFQ
jgi:hypothetical protein